VKVDYDRESDILYIKFKDSKIVNTRMLSEDLYADLDVDGVFVGIEIWKASQNAIQPLSRNISQELQKTLEQSA